jgi:hypothetical protein
MVFAFQRPTLSLRERLGHPRVGVFGAQVSKTTNAGAAACLDGLTEIKAGRAHGSNSYRKAN